MSSSSFFSSHSWRRPSRYSGGGGRHAAFALDAFDHDGGGGGRKRGAHGFEIVVRHLPEARHHRFKPLLDLLLAGRGDARERPAVEGIERGDDLEPAFVVAELAGQLEQAFIRLDAAVAEEAFAGADEADQRLRQPALRFVVIEIRGMDELARLLDQGLGDGRMSVAERADRDAAAQIEVTPARDVIEIAARTRGSARFRSAHKLGTTFCWNKACTAATSLRTIGGGDGTMSFMSYASNETGGIISRSFGGGKPNV